MLQYFDVESSNLSSVGWDGDGGLHVRFNSGAEYRYEGVPIEKFGELLAAASKGQFLNASIKPFYRFVKLVSVPVQNHHMMEAVAHKRLPSLPGEILKALFLDDRGISVEDFARRTGLDRRTIDLVIAGHIPITLDIAFRFSEALGTSQAVWLNLQEAYQS